MKKTVTLILALVLTAALSLTAYALDISSSIDIVDSNLNCSSDLTLVNNGVITIADGASMTIDENITITIKQGGKLEIQEGAELILQQGSKIIVDGGTYINNGTLTNNGGTIIYQNQIDSVTDPNNKTSFSVIGSYIPGSAAATVYSVDITWGSMEFTYTDASSGTWNPQTLEYDNATDGAWSCVADANKITVTNKSNAAVEAALVFAAADGYTLTGGFYNATKDGTVITDSKLSLDSAAPTGTATVGEAKIGTAYLQITSGTLTSGTTAAKIGSVTVTINNK